MSPNNPLNPKLDSDEDLPSFQEICDHFEINTIQLCKIVKNRRLSDKRIYKVLADADNAKLVALRTEEERLRLTYKSLKYTQKIKKLENNE